MRLVSKRNFSILMYDSIVYAIAIAVLDTNTVIPYFLREIGVPYMMPWVDAIKQFSFFLPQVFLFRYVARAKAPARLITRIMFFDRPQLLILPLLIALGCTGNILGAIFFLSIFLFFLGEGAILLYWINVLVRSTSIRERGRFFGMSQVFGGLGAAGAAWYVQSLLNGPANILLSYQKIFVLAAVVLIPSLFIFPKIRFSERMQIDQDEKIPLETLPSSELKKKGLIRLLIIQALIGLGALALPFYLLDLLDHFPSLEQNIGTLAMGSMFGVLIGGVLWGGISAWISNKRAIQASVLVSVFVPLVFLGFSRLMQNEPFVPALFAGFMLLGALSGGWLGFVNYILERSSEARRSKNLLSYNVLAVFSAIYPILGGTLRAWWGQEIILIFISVTAGIAFLLSTKVE